MSNLHCVIVQHCGISQLISVSPLLFCLVKRGPEVWPCLCRWSLEKSDWFKLPRDSLLYTTWRLCLDKACNFWARWTYSAFRMLCRHLHFFVLWQLNSFEFIFTHQSTINTMMTKLKFERRIYCKFIDKEKNNWNILLTMLNVDTSDLVSPISPGRLWGVLMPCLFTWGKFNILDMFWKSSVMSINNTSQLKPSHWVTGAASWAETWLFMQRFGESYKNLCCIEVSHNRTIAVRGEGPW